MFVGVWGRVGGAWGASRGWLRVEGVGLIFFCPKKVRPAPYPRVPWGPGEITRAPRREGQPRRRVAACRGGILPLRRERAVGHECDRW